MSWDERRDYNTETPSPLSVLCVHDHGEWGGVKKEIPFFILLKTIALSITVSVAHFLSEFFLF